MSNGTRCDVCGCFAVEDDHDGWLAVAPLNRYSTRSSGWSLFQQALSSGGDAHVCSPACLGILAIEMAGLKPLAKKKSVLDDEMVPRPRKGYAW